MPFVVPNARLINYFKTGKEIANNKMKSCKEHIVQGARKIRIIGTPLLLAAWTVILRTARSASVNVVELGIRTADSTASANSPLGRSSIKPTSSRAELAP